jgi:hypothetical protein
MNAKGNHPKRKIIILPILLMTVTLGCLCLPGNVTPTPGPIISSPTPRPPNVTEIPVLPPVAPGELNETGPWLLMGTDQGLWASNPDSSGLTQLTTVDYWGLLAGAAQPGGNLIAFLSPTGYDMHNMTLNLLSLPDGSITKVTDLTSPETEAYADLSPGDFGFTALQAVREHRNFAWSPDGTRLAFVGVMDGPSAEVYIYDLPSGEVLRVSQDDDQNYGLSWSPDGNTLVYFGTEYFGTGAGFDTAGVWSARGDGTNVTKLYTPDGGDERLLGWLDDTTAVMDTWTHNHRNPKLRLIDVVTKNTVVLSEDYIISAAVDDWLGAAMYATPSGLYFLSADERTPVLITTEEVAGIPSVRPWEHFFIVYFDNGSCATYGRNEEDYQVSPVSGYASDLDVAMYGLIWGWTSGGDSLPGVWISGPGLDVGQIFFENAVAPVWDLENNLLFFAPQYDGTYDMYRTTFRGYYQDLTWVNNLPADLNDVAWLGR